jgi:hypothetical protein
MWEADLRRGLYHWHTVRFLPIACELRSEPSVNIFLMRACSYGSERVLEVSARAQVGPRKRRRTNRRGWGFGEHAPRLRSGLRVQTQTRPARELSIEGPRLAVQGLLKHALTVLEGLHQ